MEASARLRIVGSELDEERVSLGHDHRRDGVAVAADLAAVRRWAVKDLDEIVSRQKFSQNYKLRLKHGQVAINGIRDLNWTQSQKHFLFR